MKILMLAPEPFFQPRGTPISVYFRLKALSDLSHKIDLVTYPLGEDKEIANVKILRVPNILFIKKIKIGPSFIKIPLDILLFLKAAWQLTRESYHMIFSHEEAAWAGVILAKIWGLPHIYDMHSSLPQQLANFDFSNSSFLKRIFTALEKFVLKYSHAIIVICPDLLKAVQKQGFGQKTILIENFIDFEYPTISKGKLKELRRKYASDEEKIVLYTGNFLPYQGIPLLLEAASKLNNKKVIFLLVGGGKQDIKNMKIKAEELNICERVRFAGQVPPSQVPAYISIADVLVSPRISGTNTPLKIYSFLGSGKPVVATNLWTHTQILNDNISVLVPPTPEGLAKGVLFALFDKEAKVRAQNAKKLASIQYTYKNYLKKITETLKKTQEIYSSP